MFSGSEFAQLPPSFFTSLNQRSFSFSVWAKLYAYSATDSTLLGSTLANNDYGTDDALHCVGLPLQSPAAQCIHGHRSSKPALVHGLLVGRLPEYF